MNPELLERFLAKKAKKLGITVEELKARNDTKCHSELVSESNTVDKSLSIGNTSRSFANAQDDISCHSEQSCASQSINNQSNFSDSFANAQYDISCHSEQSCASQSINNQSNFSDSFANTQYDISCHSEQSEESQTEKNQSNFSGAYTGSQDDSNAPYQPLQPKPEKVEIPSYVFGPAKMEDSLSPRPLREREEFQPEVRGLEIRERGTENLHAQIKDTRENKFALIGYPLGHSLSKVIQEAGFKSLGIDATYDILETPPDSLVDRIKYLKTNGYKGFNVTIPLKLPVSLFVDEVDKYADLARAVNTVYIEADKTLKAYNTDVIGFKRAIPSDINLQGKKVAILGTGGAAHAACVALTECQVKEIAFFTRNIPNSIELMNYVRRKFPAIDFNVYQIENIRSLEEYSMLVNTTPIGMLGKAGDMSPVDIEALQTLKKDAVVYDVIYNPKKTVLIKDAQKLGLRVITGLDMLIFQAVAAQEYWTGRTPDWKDMKIAALEVL